MDGFPQRRDCFLILQPQNRIDDFAGAMDGEALIRNQPRIVMPPLDWRKVAVLEPVGGFAAIEDRLPQRSVAGERVEVLIRNLGWIKTLAENAANQSLIHATLTVGMLAFPF